MKITIGFSKNKSFLAIGSHVIRLFQWSKFSHTYLMFSTAHGNIIFQASRGMVNMMHESVFLECNDVIFSKDIEVTKEVLFTVKSAILAQAGRSYAWLQTFVGIPLVAFFSLFGISIKNPFKYGFNCSEIVAYALELMSQVEKGRFDLNLVTPKDIYNFLYYRK